MTDQPPRKKKKKVRRAVTAEVVPSHLPVTTNVSARSGVTAVAIRGQLEMPAVAQAVEYMKAYQLTIKRLLVASDYQKIGRTKFKKKSAWRKLRVAFQLSEVIPVDDNGKPDMDAIVNVIERAPDGHPLFVRAFSMYQDPAGRVSSGYHEVHITERCCPAATGLYCRMADWDKHYCCKQGCDGRTHWSHPGDLAATAHTRAKNRAISDLIGAGEVSAEEMDAGTPQTPQKYEGSTTKKPKATPALSNKLKRGFAILIQNRPDTTEASLLKEFAAWKNSEGKWVVPRNLDHLLSSGPWSGKVWTQVKQTLIGIFDIDYVEKEFGGD